MKKDKEPGLPRVLSDRPTPVSWWAGDPAVEPFMPPVAAAIERHVVDERARVDIYNRAYEAVWRALAKRDDVDRMCAKSGQNATKKQASFGLTPLPRAQLNVPEEHLNVGAMLRKEDWILPDKEIEAVWHAGLHAILAIAVIERCCSESFVMYVGAGL